MFSIVVLVFIACMIILYFDIKANVWKEKKTNKKNEKASTKWIVVFIIIPILLILLVIIWKHYWL